MNISDLKPASSFAQRYGVKILSYGAPGSGKTPAMKTAPSPVICMVENGAGSLKDAHNIPAWDGTTKERAIEFFDWVTQSKEADNFDTICIDSVSQFCEVVLEDALKKNKHGMQAYGEMAEEVMKRINSVYFMPNKHLYLVAKEMLIEIAGTNCRRPAFPGKKLPSEIPHAFDTILHAEKIVIPGHPKGVPAFRAQESFDTLARDRYGVLNEFEPQDLGAIISKSMA